MNLGCACTYICLCCSVIEIKLQMCIHIKSTKYIQEGRDTKWNRCIDATTSTNRLVSHWFFCCFHPYLAYSTQITICSNKKWGVIDSRIIIDIIQYWPLCIDSRSHHHLHFLLFIIIIILHNPSSYHQYYYYHFYHSIPNDSFFRPTHWVLLSMCFDHNVPPFIFWTIYNCSNCRQSSFKV
jgi:hypothetical protein